MCARSPADHFETDDLGTKELLAYAFYVLFAVVTPLPLLALISTLSLQSVARHESHAPPPALPTHQRALEDARVVHAPTGARLRMRDSLRDGRAQVHARGAHAASLFAAATRRGPWRNPALGGRSSRPRAHSLSRPTRRMRVRALGASALRVGLAARAEERAWNHGYSAYSRSGQRVRAEVFRPCAAGSGIPEIKTILGGFSMKRFLGPMTLLIKACSPTHPPTHTHTMARHGTARHGTARMARHASPVPVPIRMPSVRWGCQVITLPFAVGSGMALGNPYLLPLLRL